MTRITTWDPPARTDVVLGDSGVRTSAELTRRYELLIEIASGGMGTVYIGRRLGAGGFQRLVAIKRMHASIAEDPESAGAFREEARIASLVQHANVVAIHDVHEEAGEQFLVMEYIDGVSLATLLATLRASHKRLARRVGLRIIVDALRGLHAAHELVDLDGRSLELVHRDATPHNILLGVDGSVRITDFGIARALARTVHTEPGFAKGKYAYMAPEQAFADPLDRRADVFAMGVVLWETLTGQRLFANRTAREVARLVSVGGIVAPSAAGADTLPELDRVVLRALAPWREDRFATAALFAEAIRAAAAGDGGLAPSPAIADVLELACGDRIRERRDKLRKALSGAPPAGDPTVRRLLTPPSAAIEIPTSLEPPRAAKSFLARIAIPATAIVALSIGAGAALGGVALSAHDTPRARRVAYDVVALFGAVRSRAILTPSTSACEPGGKKR